MSFRAVDFDASLAVARAARTAGARRLGLVSAMGAEPHSRIFYRRVKAELEEAVAALGFEGLVIARPSLLVSDRDELGQPPRRGEKLAFILGRLLRPVTPSNYRAIAATDVAPTLLSRVPVAEGREVLLSGSMLRGRHQTSRSWLRGRARQRPATGSGRLAPETRFKSRPATNTPPQVCAGMSRPLLKFRGGSGDLM